MPNELKNEYRFTMDGGTEDEYYDENYSDDGEYAQDVAEDGEYYDDEYDGGYYDEAETYDGEYDQISPDDEKLDRVLDELAQIRRSVGVVPGQVSGMFPGMPVQSYHAYPYVSSGNVPDQAYPIVITPPSAPQSGNEVAMYNEITRLREEVTRLNSSHEMHVELSRLKEEMERENRLKEQQLQEEIRRLNEKIGELSEKK